MNKKNFLKLSVTTLFLSVSIVSCATYFPEVALATESGVIASAIPVAIFGISAFIALVSVVALTIFAVSAMQNKNKSTVVSKNLQSESSKDKNKNPAQEANPNLEGVEKTPQNVGIFNNSEVPYPSMSSPLNSLTQNQPFPDPPLSVYESFRNRQRITVKKGGPLQFQPSSNRNMRFDVLRQGKKFTFFSLRFPSLLNTTDSSFGNSNCSNSITSETSLNPSNLPLSSTLQQQPFPDQSHELLEQRFFPSGNISSFQKPPLYSQSGNLEKEMGFWVSFSSCSNPPSLLPPLPMHVSSLNSSRSFPSLPMCVKLNKVLTKYEQQRNQVGSETEQSFDYGAHEDMIQWYKSFPINQTTPYLNSLRRFRSLPDLRRFDHDTHYAHMSMINDSFGTVPSSMVSSSTVQLQEKPLRNTFMQQIKVNNQKQSGVSVVEDDRGFYIGSNGKVLYGQGSFSH